MGNGLSKNNNKMTIEKFLQTYLRISNHDLCRMTHQDLKELFPNLKRCSIEYAEANMEEIYKGNIILVIDSKNIVVPYLKPEINYDELSYVSVELSKVPINEIDVSNLKVLTNYELKQLLNTCKNGYKVAKKARKELEDRGVKTKRYKKERKDAKNDKY